MSQDKLLTVEQVAEWFGVSTGWVRDHASGRARPVLPCRKLGKCVRFSQMECEAFLEECRKMQAVA